MVDFDINEEPVVISKATIDLLLQQEKYASDAIALYVFYYYTAKWQRTNCPRCTAGYVGKALSWGMDKIQRTKKILLEAGLIEDITSRNDSNKIIGHYIKVNFIWKKGTLQQDSQVPDLPGTGKSQALENKVTNALSTNSKNIFCNKNIPLPSPDDIFRLWNNYVKDSPLPIAHRLTSTRIKHLNARIKEYPTIREWREIFSRVLRSSFLTGNNDRGWKATFDWLISNDDKIVRLLEGRYDFQDSKNTSIKNTGKQPKGHAPDGSPWLSLPDCYYE